MNGYEKLRLPDGTVISIPSDATQEYRDRVATAILAKFPFLSEGPSASIQEAIQQQGDFPSIEGVPSAEPAVDPIRSKYFSDIRRRHQRRLSDDRIPREKEEEEIFSGWSPDKSISNLLQTYRPPSTPEYTGEEGTKIGALIEAAKSVPRGAKLGYLMLLQGIAAIPTTDRDTPREKEIRRGIRSIHEEIDPRYVGSNLINVSMGLGQYGAMAIGAATAGVAGATVGIPGGVAALLGGAALGVGMTVGEQAAMMADYEEFTGEDISSAKEKRALAWSILPGLTEVVPFMRLGRIAMKGGILPALTKKALQSGVSKEAISEGADAATKTVAQRVLAATKSGVYSAAQQAMIEAGQEGLQQYGQSIIAKYHYNDDALVGAGTQAIEEALIGGQVGAIGDLLVNIGTRAVSPIRTLRTQKSVRALRFLNDAIQRAEENVDDRDSLLSKFATSTDPAIVSQREEYIKGTRISEFAEELFAKIDQINKDPDLSDTERSGQLAIEEKRLNRIVAPWIRNKEIFLEYQRLEEKGTPTYNSPLAIVSQEELATRALDLNNRLLIDPQNITEEDAASIAIPNITGAPELQRYHPSDIVDQIRLVLRPRSTDDVVLESDRDRLHNSNEDVFDLDGMLVTQSQRDSLRELVSLTENDSPISIDQLRFWVNRVFDGGVYKAGGPNAKAMSWEMDEAGNPDSRLAIRSKPKTSTTKNEARFSKKAKDDVLSDIIGFPALTRIAYRIDDTKQNKNTDPGFEDLSPWVSDFETLEIIQELVDENNPKIQAIPVDLARRALKSRKINRDFDEFVGETLRIDPKDVKWQSLLNSEKQAVIARILSIPIQGIEGARYSDVSVVPPKAGRAILVTLATQGSKATPQQVLPDGTLSGTRKRYHFLKFPIGTSKKRSTRINNLTSNINKNLGLNLDVEDVASYIERAVDSGTLKYSNPKLKTKVEINRNPTDNLPVPTREWSEIDRIRRELTEEGSPRSERQLDQDAESLFNQKVRFDRAAELAIEEFSEIGVPETGIKVAVGFNTTYAQNEEITKHPNVIIDNKMREDAPVATLTGHGNQLVFNLSQLESKYPDGINAPIEVLMRDAGLHVRMHLYYIRDILTDAELLALKRYSKQALVPLELLPKELLVEIEKGRTRPTWRGFVDWIYEGQNKSELELEEETGVRILTALAQDLVPASQVSGTIAKIKRNVRAGIEKIIGITRSTDLLSVMRINQKIHTGELDQRLRDRVAGKRGEPSSRFFMAATKEQRKRLMKAAGKATDDEMVALANEIARSKEERVDPPPFDASRALINEFRARKEVDETPGTYLSVLNIDAINNGDVAPEALDIYLGVEDGSVKPPKMISELREFRDKGRKRTYTKAEEFFDAAYEEYVQKPTMEFGQQILLNTNPAMVKPDGSFIESEPQLVDQLNYGMIKTAVWNMLDEHLPMVSHSVLNDLRMAGNLKTQRAAYKVEGNDIRQSMVLVALRTSLQGSSLADIALRSGAIEYTYKGGHQAKQETDDYTPKGMLEFFAPWMDLDPDAKDITIITGYMFDKRVLEIFEKLQAEQLKLDQLDAQIRRAKNPDRIQKLEEERLELSLKVLLLKEKYNDTNPLMDKETGEDKPWKHRRSEEDIKSGKVAENVAAIESSDNDLSKTMVQFAKDYREFNYWLVKYAFDTGQITPEEKALYQELQHVPFYVGRAESEWHFQSLWKNSLLDQPESRDRVRGGIGQAIKGSPNFLTGDIAGSLVKNVQATGKNGGTNITGTMVIRDALDNGVAMEIGHVPDHLKDRRELLQRTVKSDDYKDYTDVRKAVVDKQLKNVRNEIKGIQKKIRANEREADRRAYPKLHFVVKGEHTSIDPKDFKMIRERLEYEERVRAQSEDRAPKKITQAQVRNTMPLKGESKFNPSSELVDHGVTKVYRVGDPKLVTSQMHVNIDPHTLMEGMFTNLFFMFPEGGPTSKFLSKVASKSVIGAAKLYRESTVRTPWFIFKNLPRDSLSAAAYFGGGPMIFFKAIKNVFDPSTMERARRFGFTQGPHRGQADVETLRQRQRLLKKAWAEENRNWLNPLHIFSNVWGAMGQLSAKSEVSTRLAVHDRMRAAGRSDVLATYQARELINYGRHGKNQFLALFAAMSPFVNGRMMGMHSIGRVMTGAYDSPLLVGRGLTPDPNGVEQKAYRSAIAFRRSAFLLGLTMWYWMRVKDEEWYKGLDEDVKNDYWIIPTIWGHKLPAPIKFPIPFELGVIMKVIPEQILRMINDAEHDIKDVSKELSRQITGSLDLLAWPQFMRPLTGIFFNENSYTKRNIVPEDMIESVMPPQQKNRWTNEFLVKVAESLDKTPLIRSLPLGIGNMMTSPMKLQYVLQSYLGSYGIYALTIAERIARDLTNENIVGTRADYPAIDIPIPGTDLKFPTGLPTGPLWPVGSDKRTWENWPVWGDFFINLEAGRAYESSLYDMISDLNKVVTTMNRIQEESPAEALEFSKKHEVLLRNEWRLRDLQKELNLYREELKIGLSQVGSDQRKRNIMYNQMKVRDKYIAN